MHAPHEKIPQTCRNVNARTSDKEQAGGGVSQCSGKSKLFHGARLINNDAVTMLQYLSTQIVRSHTPCAIDQYP